jgi:hypothetical protein
MTLKVGSKQVKFEKGKAAIAVGALEKLPGVIDALIKAVRVDAFQRFRLSLNQSNDRSLIDRPIADPRTKARCQ